MSFWNRAAGAEPIEPSQVVVGLYVWLDLGWTEHPFVTNRFLVKTQKDVDIIQSLALDGRLYVYPAQSERAAPPASLPLGDAASEAQVQATNALMEEVKRLGKAKKDKMWAQKDATARAARAWEAAASGIRDALVNLAGSPASEGEHLTQLASDTAAMVASSQDMLWQLEADGVSQGQQFHALNVITLCLTLGKKAGLNRWELADLAMAALAHDAGKAQVPSHILQNAHRKKHEEEFYRQHVPYGVDMAKLSGAFSTAALTIIADHHETLDGKGWPQKKTHLGPGARILGLVDRYDRLCSPEALGRPQLMPSEALATLFGQESGKYDPTLLALLVKLLGVYPPGTVVQLNDGTLALVVAPGPKSLQPKVLIYNPDLSKDDTPVLELAAEPDLKIMSAVRPSTLLPEVLAWMYPQGRLFH